MCLLFDISVVQILDSAERQVEDNLGHTRNVVGLATEQYARASKGSCYMWLILIAVGFIFMGMAVFVRIFSDKTNMRL